MSITWTEHPFYGTYDWTSIASNSTGTKLAAVASGGGGIWTSSDSGVSWTQNVGGGGGQYWTSIASDSTGQYLAAVASFYGDIWTSSDSGVSWTQNVVGGGGQYWSSITSDSTGTKLAAVVYGGDIWTSNNSGANWTQNIVGGGGKNWSSITSDSTGQYLAAVVQFGNIWTSNNSGANWTQNVVGGGGKNWKSITSDSTGTKLAAVFDGGDIWTSNNSGASWTQNVVGGGGKQWTSITSDSTGQYLAAVVFSGDIWTSNNSGVSWTQNVVGGGGQYWFSIASDSTGTKLAAVVAAGDIWTGTSLSWSPTQANSGYSFTFNFQGITPTSGDTYILTNNASPGDILSSYTALPADTSFTFDNVILYPGGINTLTITNQTTSVVIYNSIEINVSVVCFKEDSKILTDKGYVPIQNLRKGHLVKTRFNGYVPINMIGKTKMYNKATNERIKDQLYKCSQEQYPEIFEPLIITGCHSILVDEFKDEKEREETVKLLGDIFVTDDKYRLPACVDERTSVYEKEGFFTIYHLALEHDNYYMNYGIYANGLLVETCSKRYLKELSKMELIE
jgi:hypothetical protein